jgi:hypothetical protein
MEVFLVAIGVIVLLLAAYSVWRWGVRQKRDEFGRIRISGLGSEVYYEPWAYYLIAIITFGAAIAVIVIGLVF